MILIQFFLELLECLKKNIVIFLPIVFFTFLYHVSDKEEDFERNILSNSNMQCKIIKKDYVKGVFYINLDEYQPYSFPIKVTHSQQKEFEQFVSIGDIFMKKRENDSIWIQKPSGETKVFVYK